MKLEPNIDLNKVDLTKIDLNETYDIIKTDSSRNELSSITKEGKLKTFDIYIYQSKTYKEDINNSAIKPRLFKLNPLVKEIMDEIIPSIDSNGKTPKNWEELPSLQLVFDKQNRIKLNPNNQKTPINVKERKHVPNSAIYSKEIDSGLRLVYGVIKSASSYSVVFMNLGNHEYGKSRSMYVKDLHIPDTQVKSFSENQLTLELSLVERSRPPDKMKYLIARTRATIETKDDALEIIRQFIVSNVDYLDKYIGNKTFVDKLRDLRPITLEELNGLIYVFHQFRVELLIVAVTSDEMNKREIPEDTMEYNIVDKLNTSLGFIKFSTKFSIDTDGDDVVTDGKTTEMYRKIIKMYGLFEGDLFTGYKNPLEDRLNELYMHEVGLGLIPGWLTKHIISALDYHGKNIYLIFPPEP